MSNLFVAQDHYFRQAKKLKYVARSAFKLLEIQKKHLVIKPKGAKVLDLGCAPGAWLQVACQLLGGIQNGGLVVGVDLQQMRVPSAYCDTRVSFIQADAFQLQPWQLREVSPRAKDGFTTILSDMCPPTSGIGDADVRHSLDLAERAARLALGESIFRLDLDRDDRSPNLEASKNSLHLIKRLQTRGETIGRSEKEILESLEESDNDSKSSGEKTVREEGGLLVPGGNFVVKLLEGSGTKEYGERCKKLFRHVAWLRPDATRHASREIYLIAKGRH